MLGNGAYDVLPAKPVVFCGRHCELQCVVSPESATTARFLVAAYGTMCAVDLEIEMLANIRCALDEHSAECCQRPKAILLNPGNYQLIGWDEVLGLPVLPDPRVEPKKFRLVCGDHGWGGVYDGELVWWTADGDAHHREEDVAAA